MFNVLPIYDTKDKQNFRREICGGDVCTFKLICGQTRFLPFQFMRPYSIANLVSISLYCFDDTLYDSGILLLIDPSEITIENAGATDWITYFGNKDLSQSIPCGTYYFKIIDDDSNIWYSELFTVETFNDNTTDILIKVYDSELPVIDINDGTDSLKVN